MTVSNAGDVIDLLTAEMTANGLGNNPPDQIIRRVTTEYLNTLDPAVPAAPQTALSQTTQGQGSGQGSGQGPGLGPGLAAGPGAVSQRLIALVNRCYALENTAASAAREKLLPLRHLTNYQIAQALLRLHHIIRIAPSARDTDREYDLIAMYVTGGINLGVYSTSEDEIRTVARRYYSGLTVNDFKEVMAILREDSPRTHRCENRDLIAVNNGIFDYAAKQLLPFTPDLVFLSKSHVDYDPNATSPRIVDPVDATIWEVEDWMASLSDDPEIVELLWEILGAIIRPHVRWNKTAWFYSEQGNNGKGTLCELMRNLTGPGAYTSIPLSDFGKEFALEPLVRASAIIVDENDVGTFIDRAANLKAIVTSDVIQINRKYRMPIAYQFFGFMVQCLNEFPRVKDKSESFYRRQLFVPFEKNFAGSERRYIKNDYLHRGDVLRYVLRRVLHMDYYQLSEPVAAKAVLAEYKEFNDPVRAWWEEFHTQLAWDLVPFTFAYDLYRAWFVETSPSGSPVSRVIFVRDLCSIVREDPHWHCKDKNRKVRPGQMMSRSEPLIATYDLARWKSPTYHGKDPNLLSQPALADSYRGILRISAMAGTATGGPGTGPGAGSGTAPGTTHGATGPSGTAVGATAETDRYGTEPNGSMAGPEKGIR
ncbi:phage/plasmid primase, P4 family [Nocardioides sp. NBC_00368]|uniref:DNA primase family protein n=1 Tax=Nocardioides sp. NBC_00368 TaxID=2976000 RepID=UPI002E1B7B0B